MSTPAERLAALKAAHVRVLKRREQPEQSLHRSIATLLDRILPKDAFWFHVPNGGKRNKTEAGIFKALGVRAGVPDILIAFRGRLYAIELKAPNGRLLVSQRETIARLDAAGVQTAVCRSIEDVVETLGGWGVTPKVRVAA